MTAESTNIDEELAELSAGCAEILPAEGLAERLRKARSEGRPLRVKLGIDPSGTDLTLGHAVVLRKLRQFQDYGHTAVLIVGDFTGRVGDPTGRNETRKVLSAEDTAANSSTYLEQVQRILSSDNLEVRRNSEWLDPMTFADVLGYSRMLTVARVLERDDFAKRFKAGQPISLMEFMYPMMQGLDSVFIRSDIELGGTDQTYNNLVGRALQSQMDQAPQIVMTLPLLRGTDGAEKMGKSLGNWIAIGEAPTDQYGKLLSISDDLVRHYAELCCGWTVAEVEALHALLGTDPFAAKRSVAFRIVELYHGADAATEAADGFDRRFRKGEIDAEALAEFAITAGPDGLVNLVELLCDAGLTSSKSEARRMIASGAVRLDGDKLDGTVEAFEPEALVGKVLQRGKRHAVRLA